MNPKQLIKNLKKIFGERVKIEDEDKIPYLTDATGLYIESPLAVVFPINVLEVRKLIELARKNKVPLFPRGGGSSLSGGPIPTSRSGIVVSFARMNRVIETNLKDMQVIVEPGTVLEELNILLRKYGVFFPVDPASSSVATIGGMIAENAGGVRAVKYGVMRNWVLSLEVVTGRGDIIETGYKTFKQVVGYDLTSLFVGSEGTLGLITKATLRIAPLPKYHAICYGFFPDVSTGSKAIHEVVLNNIDVSAIEILDKNTLEAIKKFKTFDYMGESMVLIEISGNDLGYIKSQVSIVKKIFQKNSVLDFLCSSNDEEYEKLWSIRKSAAPALANLKERFISLDPTIPISKVPIFMEKVNEICEKYGVLCATFGHAGDGNVHPNIVFNPEDINEVKRVDMVIEEIYKLAIKLGGTISGEHGVGLEKIKYLKFEVDEKKLSLFKEIKKIFDPDNILNPMKIFPKD